MKRTAKPQAAMHQWGPTLPRQKRASEAERSKTIFHICLTTSYFVLSLSSYAVSRTTRDYPKKVNRTKI